jgi:hypothetical protein
MWQVFRVDCFAGGFVEVVVPRSEQRGGSQRELQEACNARSVDIASRETDEGTILAASRGQDIQPQSVEHTCPWMRPDGP